ncbi:Inner membrane protein YgaP [Durusdinium trenchii]
MRRSLAGLAGVAGPIWSCWLFAPCRHFSPAGRCGHIHLRAEKIIDLSSLDLSVNDTDEADDWEAMIDRMDFQGGLPTASDFRAPEQSSAYDEEAFLEIEATELKRALQNGYAIWDVREPDEYRLGHLPQSKNVPLSDLEAALEPFPERGLLLICATGSRSSQAQVRLSRVYGISNVFSVRGGLAAWEAAGGQVSLNYSGDDL